MIECLFLRRWEYGRILEFPIPVEILTLSHLKFYYCQVIMAQSSFKNGNLIICLISIFLQFSGICLSSNLPDGEVDQAKNQIESQLEYPRNNEIGSETSEAESDSEENNSGTRTSSLSTNPDDVRFFLYYDPKRPNVSRELFLDDVKLLKKAKFRKGAQVIFITHGFMSGYNFSDSLVPTVKDAYLSQNITNVIAVDWQQLSTAPAPESFLSYYAVIKRVPIVGSRIADFILFLIRERIIRGPQDVHLVGHSLGAHVSGVAGNEILNRTGNLIDRITGLDPAGPLYAMARDEYRIDSSDANFVDILHTAIGTLGSGDIHGHVDFFANGGRGTSQKECYNFTLTNPGPFFGSGLTGVCSHSRAYHYYARSIRRTQPELYGCRCDHRDFFFFFVPNECAVRDTMMCEDRTLFGEYVPRTARGNYFINIEGMQSLGLLNFPGFNK